VPDELVSSAWHAVEQYADSPIAADHGRLRLGFGRRAEAVATGTAAASAGRGNYACRHPAAGRCAAGRTGPGPAAAKHGNWPGGGQARVRLLAAGVLAARSPHRPAEAPGGQLDRTPVITGAVGVSPKRPVEGVEVGAREAAGTGDRLRRSTGSRRRLPAARRGGPGPGRLIVLGATGVVASLLVLARVSSPRAGRARATPSGGGVVTAAAGPGSPWGTRGLPRDDRSSRTER